MLSMICLLRLSLFFFFNDTATTEIYTLSLHDALPIFEFAFQKIIETANRFSRPHICFRRSTAVKRSEEHTSELQSHLNLVCRLLLEKKNNRSRERSCQSLRPIRPSSEIRVQTDAALSY